jgi:putative DNA primase/helicase
MAVIGRIILLLLSHSWLGKEDHTLESAMLGELAGILNWSLAGLHRLAVENRNCFTRVPAADEAIVTMRDLASPVAAFVREQCIIEAANSVPTDMLYAAYKTWADNSGHTKAAKHVFGRDLRAAVPSISIKQEGTAHRIRIYMGIALRESPNDEFGLQ